MPAKRVRPTSSSRFTLVLTTAGSSQEAKRIARKLLKAKLAACVNLIPKIDSYYWWRGRVEHGSEVLLFIKTKRSQLKPLSQLLKETHSYELPELLALPIHWGDKSYLQWLQTSISR